MSVAVPQRVRLPAWLLALVFTTFVFATDDYVIAGVLPAIAADLGVSEAAGGQLVTVFSLAFALAAPVASVVTATWPRRGLLTWALALFVVANWASAFTTSYALLMGLRVLAALAAAAVVPAAYAIATALAPEGRQGRYLALVMGGLTGSLALGVPLGTWVGGAFGWQATFGLGGALGLVALVAIRSTLPEQPPAPAMPIRNRLRPLARPQVLLGMLGIVAIVLGSMMVLTYLAPFLRDLAGAGPTELGWVFVLAGLAGLAGGQLGGRAADRWGADRALITGVAGFAAVMAIFSACWFLRPVPLLALLPLLLVWAAVSWWIPPPAQTRLLALAGPAGPQALALNSSAVYIGVSGGGALGGLVLDRHGSGWLPAVAAGVELAALALFWLAGRAPHPRRSRPGSDAANLVSRNES
ncbi:Predicted arabinose efflux permease, MFS family [Streptosporangium canum]|uniref:Predicted arabinose efflux permease, MFS family n=1 Tax=Streptosporangium canum TaxID=324952 RepID=A0A1I4BU58_9ACTN|nr:MFS transporter [Streptosporangium canum]SFK72195.1 Predicted arabinose efflux permease, MFS family [Streptosporangium canum]